MPRMEADWREEYTALAGKAVVIYGSATVESNGSIADKPIAGTLEVLGSSGAETLGTGLEAGIGGY